MLRRLAALLALSVLAACGGSAGDTAGTPTTTTGASSTTSTEAPGAPATPSTDGTVQTFFLRNGLLGAGERRPVSGGDARAEAVKALAAGPTDAEKAAGLSSAVPGTVVIRSINVADGVATIDLTRPFETHDTQPQVAQVVFTLTQFPDVQKVKFLIEGQDNGATGVPPVSREAFGRFVPVVLLESPTPGLATPNPLKVTGTLASEFSSFPYKVENAFGQEITRGTITAKFGSPRKRFDQAVELPAGTTGGMQLIIEPPEGSTMPAFRVPFTLT